MRCRTGIACLLVVVSALANASFDDRVRHGYADSRGVKIHYAEIGEGPLVVMVHGFPDFWYSWRAQMQALAGDFRVVAIDQRGYNLSDQPQGMEAYAMANLVADVVAVVRHLGAERATIVGHDWGGAVAWQVALNAPEVAERLVVLNLPHPNGFARELANNPEQQANSGYARRFQEGSPADPDIFFGMPMTAQNLAGWVSDPAEKPRYVEAFERSSFAGMLNFYKANYARPGGMGAEPIDTPRVRAPVLMFHGLADTALHSDGLNNTWDWLDADLTLVTVPGAGHFVQQDAAELVSSTMLWWLKARVTTR